MGKRKERKDIEQEKQQYRVTIKNWPEGDKPREKMITRGSEALSDAELLAIMINSGSGEKSALDIAKELLATYKNFRAIAKRPITELQENKGIGPARAVNIMAAFEIGRRYAAIGDNQDEPILSPEDVARRYIPKMRDLPTERFIALLMNNAGKMIKEYSISEGIVNASLVHPREVFRAAVTELATSIILVHNHPSGTRNASKEDHAITKQLVEAGKLMDIHVRDHVIICGDTYLSFAENGWL